MDEHARDEHEDNVDVFPGDGSESIPLPGGAHLVHHVLCGIPGDFVCFGRVEVRACAEEKSRERDENEGERHVPCCVEPVVCFLREKTEYHYAVYAGKEDAEPHGGNGANRRAEVLVYDGAHGKEE